MMNADGERKRATWRDVRKSRDRGGRGGGGGDRAGNG